MCENLYNLFFFKTQTQPVHNSDQTKEKLSTLMIKGNAQLEVVTKKSKLRG